MNRAEAKRGVAEYLKASVHVSAGIHVNKEYPYTCLADFILQHAVEYEAAPWDGRFRKGEPSSVSQTR